MSTCIIWIPLIAKFSEHLSAKIETWKWKGPTKILQTLKSSISITKSKIELPEVIPPLIYVTLPRATFRSRPNSSEIRVGSTQRPGQEPMTTVQKKRKHEFHSEVDPSPSHCEATGTTAALKTTTENIKIKQKYHTPHRRKCPLDLAINRMSSQFYIQMLHHHVS